LAFVGFFFDDVIPLEIAVAIASRQSSFGGSLRASSGRRRRICRPPASISVMPKSLHPLAAMSATAPLGSVPMCRKAPTC
jgi:hypothetical protein